MDTRSYLLARLAERNWKPADLARACRVKPGVAYTWLAEDALKRQNPGPASCQKIAAALGVPVDELLAAAGHRLLTNEAREMAIDAELRLRTERLASALSQYPRVYWAALVDVFDRMAELPAIAQNPLATGASEPRTTERIDSVAGDSDDSKGGLVLSSRGVRELVFAH